MALQPLPGLGLPHKTSPFIHIFSLSPPSSYPSSWNTSLWTTSAHLAEMHPSGPHPPIWFLVFPLDLWSITFLLKLFFFGILSISIPIMWPAHPTLLILMSSTMFDSRYKLYSSLFHLGCQRPPSCVRPYILRNIFISNEVLPVYLENPPCYHILEVLCFFFMAQDKILTSTP